jgi:hypothetical protein
LSAQILFAKSVTSVHVHVFLLNFDGKNLDQQAYLQNIPTWSPLNGDSIICIAELRLGLLAQSCVAPGFSTLISNFFTTRSYETKTPVRDLLTEQISIEKRINHLF